MRIEMITGHNGARSYYKIDKTELIIGSSNQCDIVLPDPQISRRHLSLLIRGDRFYVIDHNSTNGTFINEEKLRPTERVEWPPETPMRLAGSVILTLVDDGIEESDYQAPTGNDSHQDKTRVVSLAEIRASQKRIPKPVRRPVKKKKKSMLMPFLMVIGLMAAAYYLNVTKGVKMKRSAEQLNPDQLLENIPGMQNPPANIPQPTH